MAAPDELPSIPASTAVDAALRHRSPTAAAKGLGRTQGAVSRQVAALEEHVGAELFHRETRALLVLRGGLRAAIEAHRG